MFVINFRLIGKICPEIGFPSPPDRADIDDFKMKNRRNIVCAKKNS